jgi:hypothetical protein
MNRKSGALLGLGVVLVGIQLVPVERTNPPVTGEIRAPDEVMAILERSCRDCHTNETSWPWYSRVAPVSWLVAHDVDEGREHANFSEWDTYDAKERDDVLEEMVEVMEKGEMPLRKYTALHPSAKLREADRERLAEWARAERVEPSPAAAGPAPSPAGDAAGTSEPAAAGNRGGDPER